MKIYVEPVLLQRPFCHVKLPELLDLFERLELRLAEQQWELLDDAFKEKLTPADESSIQAYKAQAVQGALLPAPPELLACLARFLSRCLMITNPGIAATPLVEWVDNPDYWPSDYDDSKLSQLKEHHLQKIEVAKLY